MTLRPPDVDEPINVERRTEAGMQVVRWRHVSLVFQGAMNSLDPVKRVDYQIAQAINLHERAASAGDVRARIGELLTTVGLTPALGRRYAHQLSGGQRQRVMIALALACRPSLVIADEPTTALDVVMQAQILELLEHLREQLGLALILISHDLGRAGGDLRPDRRDVRGPDRRDRPGAQVFDGAAAPVHQAPARLAAGDRRLARAGAADPGRPARPGRAAAGLPLPAALPLRGRAAASRTRRCARYARPRRLPATSRPGPSGRAVTRPPSRARPDERAA